MAHRVVNEGGISQAMLLHLRFHNKWLSPGKPKQITPTIRAAQDTRSCGLTSWWQRCPLAALPVPGKGQSCPYTHLAPGADLAEN